MMENYSPNNQYSKTEEAGIRFYSSPEEQEKARLLEAVQRTPTEKFLFLTHLMKLQRLMNKQESSNTVK